MNNDTSQQESLIYRVIAVITVLISMPLLVGAIIGMMNPPSILTQDDFPQTYEQFRIEKYEKMSLSTLILAFPGEGGRTQAMQQAYDAIAVKHWKLIAEQNFRLSLMYGSLVIISSGYLLYSHKTSKRKNT